jgi:membrane-associated protease RseP (regulator of RpoE activity)
VLRGTNQRTLEVTPEAGGLAGARGALRLELNGPGERNRLREFNFNIDPDALRRGIIPLRGPTLGVTVTGLSSQLADYFGVKEGVLVSFVESGSAAAEAGIRAGDVITAVGGRAVTGAGDLSEAIRRAQPGSAVEIAVTRDRKQLTLTATVPAARRPVLSERSGLPV